MKRAPSFFLRRRIALGAPTGEEAGGRGRGLILSVSLEPPRRGSAAEMHLQAIAEGLRTHGYKVATEWRGAAVSALRGVLKHHLGVVRQVPTADLVYFRWHPLDLFATLVCRVARKPYVLEMNGTLDDLLSARPIFRLAKWPLKRFIKWQLAGADGIIAVSSPLGRMVSSGLACEVPLVVIPNGAPRELAGLMREVPKLPRYAVYVGSLLPRQGIRLMLEARHSQYWPRDMGLVIAGGGELSGMVQDHERHECVRYLGSLDRAEALDVVSGATVSLSLQDPGFRRNHVMGLPLKVSESLLLGVPVVGSDISDVRELIGLLPGCRVVDATSPDAVARAVAEVESADPQVRRILVEAAEDEFSWAMASARTAQFLAILRGGHKTTPCGRDL